MDWKPRPNWSLLRRPRYFVALLIGFSAVLRITLESPQGGLMALIAMLGGGYAVSMYLRRDIRKPGRLGGHRYFASIDIGQALPEDIRSALLENSASRAYTLSVGGTYVPGALTFADRGIEWRPHWLPRSFGVRGVLVPYSFVRDVRPVEAEGKLPRAVIAMPNGELTLVVKSWPEIREEFTEPRHPNPDGEKITTLLSAGQARRYSRNQNEAESMWW